MDPAIDHYEGLSALQQRLRHKFADPALLELALTHRSYGAVHNERLEYLGDSVLNLAVSHLLYQALGACPEGELSRVRANLVKQETLHHLALGLGIATHIKLGEGEARSGGRKRASILADVLEAIIGAVYLDAGFPVALALVKRLFEHVEIHTGMGALSKDPKTELQEWLQGRRMQLPQYRVVNTTGVAHRQVFEVVCEVAELSLSTSGHGNARRAAEQAAAAAMLRLVLALK